MSSLNRATLLGNVGRDPEIRSLPNGGRVASLSLATSESWKDKASGERQERTEWHRVSVFDDRLVDLIEKRVSKGDKLYVEGQLQTRKFTDRDGNERHTTEIVLQRFRGEIVLVERKTEEREQPASSGYGGSPAGPRRPAPRNDLDDDIPF